MSYDIPKGCLEPGEDPRECAARELYEETSIVLSDSEKASMKDLGVVPYTSYKDLHLFYIESKIPDLKTLKCISTWDDNGTPRPEVNDFKKVSLDDLSLLFKSLQASIKTAFTKLN
jgi:8-oxo-dGTP pyrophosphatase MutT (NUDIX family)